MIRRDFLKLSALTVGSLLVGIGAPSSLAAKVKTVSLPDGGYLIPADIAEELIKSLHSYGHTNCRGVYTTTPALFTGKGVPI